MESIKLILDRGGTGPYRVLYKDIMFDVTSSNTEGLDYYLQYILKKDSIVTLLKHMFPWYEFKVNSISEFNIQKREVVLDVELIKDYLMPLTIYMVGEKIDSNSTLIKCYKNTLEEAIEELEPVRDGKVYKASVYDIYTQIVYEKENGNESRL